MAVSIYGPLEDGPDMPYFRLLTLHAAHNSTDPLHCTVSKQSLASCGDYEALSYCWGDAAGRLPIYCNNEQFAVTRNLEAALRHLRNKEDDRCLWIDAVCINQDDMEERNSQVLLMRSIYRSASKVVVWLGEDADDSDLVFPLCQRMYQHRNGLLNDMDDSLLWGHDRKTRLKQKLDQYRLKLTDEAGGRAELEEGLMHQDSQPQRQPRNEDDGEQRQPDTQSSDSDVTDIESHALSGLLQRPWFQRCWVVQEFCLAKEVIAMCGPSVLPWDIFYFGTILSLFSGKKALRGRPEKLFRSGFMMITSLKLSISEFLDGGTVDEGPLDLLRLMWMTRTLDATDPRDKIYSILGLVSKQEAEILNLRPNYGMSIEDSYLEAATKVMWESKTLDILTTDRMENPRQHLALPSWVPDWSYVSTPAPINILERSEAWSTDEDYHASPFAPYCASDSAKLYTPELIAPRTLRLSGYVLDDIIQIEKVLTVPSVGGQDVETSTTSFFSTVSIIAKVYASVGSYFETLAKWEYLALDKKRDPYPTGEPANVVFASTMCFGNMRGGSVSTLKQFERWRTTLRWPKKLMVLRYFGAHYLGAVYTILLAILGILTSKARGDRTFSTATELTLYRRLARTRRGYLAVVPASSGYGDSVALFEGCKMPLVLRAKGKQWETVGPAYVHGVMHGEAWDAKRCVSMELV
ncbi:heterokaryon incompatibility protein-domain-containing protein [Xylariales sp. PMI_506]|nr:heterokaryon incompatibility protein-domain-containing protein [Xylariales sp. PMI_506]